MSKETRQSLRDYFEKLFEAGYYLWGGIGMTKAPLGRGWQEFGNRLPSDEEIKQLFDRIPSHIGIILPYRDLPDETRAKIVVLDCECEQVGKELGDLLETHCPKLLKKIAIRENPKSGGMHFILQVPLKYVFPTIQLHDKTIDLKKHGQNQKTTGKGNLVFETLGTSKGAKYCIVHDGVREYATEVRLEDLQTLTNTELETLLEILGELEKLHPPEKKPPKKQEIPSKKKNARKSNQLIERFNDEVDVGEMLKKAGWQFAHEDGEHWYYTRPGKDGGVSASIRKDNHLTHIFTSSSDFEEGETYTPFQVYAKLEFGIDKGGDYKEAVRALKTRCGAADLAENEGKTELVLPSWTQGIEACAQVAFHRFGELRELFSRGGKVQELVSQGEEHSLETVTSGRLCSLVERHFATCIFVRNKDGSHTKERAPCKKNSADVLLTTEAARELLPRINIVASNPIMALDGRILQQGYDGETGCYVLKRMKIPDMALEVAVRRIIGLLKDFSFTSDGDRARAIAALLTPALTLGGFLERTPLTMLEAHDSQTGKGYHVRLVATLYGECVRYVVQRNGGVGGLDESLAMRLMSGNPFICFDNLRGRLDSSYLEAMLTAEGPFSVRVPYKGEIQIDSRRFCLFGTSNAVELTRDLANRISIVRLRKQPPGYEFRKWREGDLIEHVRANQRHLLGAVFSVLRHWINEGKPRTAESRHDFRHWAQPLDWIVRNVFKTVPLMDRFEEAKMRMANSSLGFVRQLAHLVEQRGRSGSTLSASELYSLCEESGLEVPGCQGKDEQAGRMQVGKLLKRGFDG